MTNYEKYRDKIIATIKGGVGVNKFTNEVELCGDMDCELCISSHCDGDDIGDWLNAEYVPPKDSMEICEVVRRLRMVPNQVQRVKSIEVVDGGLAIKYE